VGTGEPVHPQTAYRWFWQGRTRVRARGLPSGTIWVDAIPARAAGDVVLSALSGRGQRRGLGRQVVRLAGWAPGRGHGVAGVVVEVGSGLSGTRRRLRRVLSEPSARVVVGEHRDRLARFGVEQLEAARAAQGRRIVVAGDGETADDLAGDMIEVLTGVCAGRFGRRGARNRAMRAVTAAKRDLAAEVA
jgi:putative resolvase